MPSLQMPSVDAQSSVFGSPKKLTGRSEGVGGLVKTEEDQMDEMIRSISLNINPK